MSFVSDDDIRFVKYHTEKNSSCWPKTETIICEIIQIKRPHTTKKYGGCCIYAKISLNFLW